MQENKSFENPVETKGGGAETGRHRASRKPIGRRARIASLSVALVGLGFAGVTAATAAENGRSGDSAEVALNERARAEAAERADRSARDGAASPTSPAASPSTTSAAPSPTEKTNAAAPTKPSPKPPAWVSPMPGAETTSCFGQRWGTLHAGIDLAEPENTPIHAAGAGTVVAAGWAYTGYGISVVIDHGNGYLTHYAHQNKTNVEVGQKVSAGDLIGWEGSTGDSTGPHLHFEVHNGLWNQVDPGPWMRARGVNLGC